MDFEFIVQTERHTLAASTSKVMKRSLIQLNLVSRGQTAFSQHGAYRLKGRL